MRRVKSRYHVMGQVTLLQKSLRTFICLSGPLPELGVECSKLLNSQCVSRVVQLRAAVYPNVRLEPCGSCGLVPPALLNRLAQPFPKLWVLAEDSCGAAQLLVGLATRSHVTLYLLASLLVDHSLIVIDLCQCTHEARPRRLLVAAHAADE